jgi:hypothetical protein
MEEVAIKHYCWGEAFLSRTRAGIKGTVRGKEGSCPGPKETEGGSPRNFLRTLGILRLWIDEFMLALSQGGQVSPSTLKIMKSGKNKNKKGPKLTLPVLPPQFHC